MFGLKLIHEMAHAIVCKRYGGKVYTMGLMFIVFTPLPYVDASSTWSMRSQKHRVQVGAAGMVVELFLAAIACMAWYFSGPGFFNGMMFNLMVAGSVSALLFNGNPLLRFDAYYMLSDAMNMPNLYQKAGQQWTYWGDKYLLGTREATPPGDDPRETKYLATYGIASFAYRMLVMLFIAQILADLWIGFGVMMLAMLFVMLVAMPLFKLFKHLVQNPTVRPTRKRAWTVTVGCAMAMFVGIGLIPVSDHLEAPAVIQSQSKSTLFSEAGGILAQLNVRDGQRVQQGDVLMVFENPELDFTLRQLEGQQQELDWRLRSARDIRGIDLSPIQDQLAVLDERRALLESRKASLIVTAPIDGIFSAPSVSERIGSNFRRGERLGTVLDDTRYRATVVVPQDEVANLFSGGPIPVSIKLTGKPSWQVEEVAEMIPFQRYVLPDRALGINGGGRIAVQQDQQGREHAIEPFFEMRVPVSDDTLREGQLARARLPLTDKPLWRIWRVISVRRFNVAI